MQMLSFCLDGATVNGDCFGEIRRYIFKRLASVCERICFVNAFEKCFCSVLVFVIEWDCWAM